MRTIAIVNPSAGGGRGEARAKELCERIRAATPATPLEVWTTTGPGEATHLARRARDEGAHLVIAAGGDGTVFEVVNGLLAGRSAPLPALSVLATGTGNSFVRDVDLADPLAAVDAISAGRRRKVDVLRVVHTDGELYSINLVSLGFSAEAGDLTNRRFKGLGVVGYISAVVASVARLHPRPFPFALDDGPPDERPVTLLSFCNSRFTGGAMMMAPDADPSDGLVDSVWIGPMNRRRFLSSFPKIFRGTHGRMHEVELRRARSVRFTGDSPVPVMIDGEVRSLTLRAIEVLPGVLEVAT
ncbi:MAG: diacylglycerol kinase family protein [Myxococcota bacterium]